MASMRSTTVWSSAVTVRNRRWRSAAIAVERASLGSLLVVRSSSRSRTRAARRAGTSTTSCPAATRRWATRRPRPCPLDPPTSFGPAFRPCQQVVDLAAAGLHAQLVEDLFVFVDGHCGVGTLVRVDPDGDHAVSLVEGWFTAADIPGGSAHASVESCGGGPRRADASFRRQPSQATGTYRANPSGPSDARAASSYVLPSTMPPGTYTGDPPPGLSRRGRSPRRRQARGG